MRRLAVRVAGVKVEPMYMTGISVTRDITVVVHAVNVQQACAIQIPEYVPDHFQIQSIFLWPLVYVFP